MLVVWFEHRVTRALCDCVYYVVMSEVVGFMVGVGKL